jgi:hypothetical protein
VSLHPLKYSVIDSPMAESISAELASSHTA